MEASRTGISHPQEKRIMISYVVGRLSFFDTPKVYNEGSDVEGKVSACCLQCDSLHSANEAVCVLSDTTLCFQVKAVYYNNTPMADMPVYLFEGERWSSRRLQNLTTDSDGVATFTLNAADLIGNAHLHVTSNFTISIPQHFL